MMRPLRLLVALVFALTAAVGLRATLGPTQQMLLGNPSSATADANNHVKYLIQRAQYALDYSDTLREPNWVAWNLTTADVGGSGRSNDFFVDTTLPPTFTPVLTTAYQGSGYDRGHMCPSGDRTIDRANNDVTFYMSNMVPQAPDNNQGVWGNFESYCRTLASAGNEVLIISGPSGFAGSSIASGVAIPGYVWKVVVVVPLGAGSALDRINAGTRVIAIKIPNIQGVRSDPWQNYITSAAAIETDTGYTFFTELSAPLAATLRAKIDGQTAVGAPAIVDQPIAQTTIVGGSVTFTVSATGNAPLSYQWYKDDAEIAGATSPSLTIASAQAADMGEYYAVVTNNVGLATSNPAALIINGLPPIVSTPPQAQTVAAGGSVTFAVVATGSPTLTYQWRKAGAPISGATQASYTLNNAQAADAVAYDIVVTNSVSTVTSASALLTVTPSAPTIVNHPVTQTATGGTIVTLSVVARGTEPLSYQWRKGGVPLTNTGTATGALSSTLVLTGVSGSDAGSYDVVVTNSVGSATSNAATLTVNAATIVWTFGPDAAGATPNPTSGLPVDITGGTVLQGNNNGTTVMLTTASASGSAFSGAVNAGAAARIGALNKAAGGSAYFEFTLDPADGKKLVVTSIAFGSRSTSTGPAAYSIFSDFDGYAAALATGTLSTGGTWAMITPASFASVTGTTGAPVTFRIYGHNGAGGATANTANWRIDDLKVSVSTITASAAIAPAVIATTPTNGTIGAATTTPVTVTFNQPVQIAGPWFSITSAANGPLTATVTGGPSTYTLTPPTSFPYGDTITVTILAGQVVEKDTGTLALPANYTFSFGTGLPVAPAIVAQPVARVVPDGGSTTFSVTASGTAPLTYVWRKNGTPLSGNPSASTATLALTGLTAADQGNYSVLVSNAAGSVTSDEAALTVTAVAPAIVAQPASTTVSTGATATLSVGATGTGPLTYQWRKGGTPLVDGPGVVGATSAILSLNNASAATAGSYDVVVTNVVTSVTSQSATVSVTSATLAVATWDFTTADPSVPLPAGITGGTVTQGNNNGTTTLITTTSASGSGFSGGGNAGAAARIGALNQASGGSAYFEFTLTPASPAHRIVATDISFGSRSTGTGPQAYSVFSSVDGYATALAAGTLANNSAWALKEPVFAGVRGLAGAPVTFRIYGHSGTGSPGSGTANWRIDDLKLTVGAELLPAIAATSPVSGATGVTLNAPVTITFNQPVAAGAGSFAVTSALTGAVPTTVTGGPTTYTLTPATTWSYNDTLTVNIVASHVFDAATGTLGMPANASFSFATPVVIAPAIVTPPVAQTATAGDTVSFTVAASGTAPLAYQWRKAGTPISGNASAQTVTLTLAGVLVADAGDYDVVISNPAGTVTSDAVQLTVNKAAAAIALAGLSTVYDGTPRMVTASTTPTGLAVQITYDGSATAPVAAGNYAVVATVSDANYAGSLNGILSVAKATASVALSGLSATYDGTAKSVTAATTPAGLPVAITYNGSATPPSAVGNYAVVATITHANYAGSASGTLAIGPGTATVVLSGLSQSYDGTPKSVTAATTPSGLPVAITYNGSATPPSAAGSYAVVATVTHASYAGSVSGTLVIGQGSASIALSGLSQLYDGTPRIVTATTTPAGLDVIITYGTGLTPPTEPGAYAVVATIDDDNYSGTVSGTLVVTTPVIVRHAPTMNGGLDGSVQVLLPESLTLNGNAWVSGDIFVPGLPTVRLNGNPTYAGTRSGTGAATPANYTITLNGGAVARYIVRRTDAVTLPTLAAVPSSNNNVTLNGNGALQALAPGNYGQLIANGNRGFILGVAGATTPAVYNVQSLILNGGTKLELVGPVILRVNNGLSLNGNVGSSTNPEWLALSVYSGGVTLNGNVKLYGSVLAPNGTVIVNGNSVLTGTVIADRLTINGNGLVDAKP